MTAVDVDALAKLREAGDLLMPLSQSDEFPSWVEQDYGDGGSAVIAECYGEDRAALIAAAVNALPDLLPEVRQGRALPDNVRELCDSAADGYVPVVWLRDLLAAVDGGELR